MALRTPPLYLQAGSHTAENDRLGMQGIISTEGVRSILTDFLVTQSGTPGMSVSVAAGWAWVLGTTSSTQGMYSTYNDAAVTLTVTTANPTNPRIDRVCLTIRDAAYAGANNDVILQVIAGTPSASPTAPALPASSLSLATIAVAAGAASIVNANITDLRTRASMSLAGTGAVVLSPTASQTVISQSSAVKPLIVRGAAGQSASLLEFQSSAGTPVRAVLPDGTITGQNLLYNGAMQVAQRGTSTASITTAGYYTADRWTVAVSSLGTWTNSVEVDAPSGSGLRNSFKVLCTSADSSPAAGDFLIVGQKLEGQDLQRVKKGTSAAEQLTLSFWVKSNVTGTYIIELSDSDNSRQVSASYSVAASGTWERKTITFPADTTGIFDNDNAASMDVFFWLGAGSNFTSGTRTGTWGTTTTANRAVGQTNLAAATNNYWQITGVQLEVGPVASAFEFKSYGQELRECQRYYYLHVSGNVKGFGVVAAYTATSIYVSVPLPVTMRAAPSLVATSGTNYYTFYRNGANDGLDSWTLSTAYPTIAHIYNTTDTSGTAGWAGIAETNNASASIAFSAEL